MDARRNLPREFRGTRIRSAAALELALALHRLTYSLLLRSCNRIDFFSQKLFLNPGDGWLWLRTDHSVWTAGASMQEGLPPLIVLESATGAFPSHRNAPIIAGNHVRIASVIM